MSDFEAARVYADPSTRTEIIDLIARCERYIKDPSEAARDSFLENLKSSNPELYEKMKNGKLVVVSDPVFKFLIKEAQGSCDSHAVIEESTQLLNQYTRDDDRIQLLLTRSKAYLDVKRPREVLNDAKSILSIDANIDKAFEYQARAHHSLEEYEKALDAIDTAIKLKKEFSGSFLSNQNNAIKKEDDNSPYCFFLRAGILCILKRYEQSIPDLQQVLRLNCSEELKSTAKRQLAVASNNTAGQLGSQGKLQEALPHISRACELCPEETVYKKNHAEILKNISRRLASQGKYQEALEYISRACELCPENEKYIRSLVYVKIKADPNEKNVVLAAGEIYRKQGKEATQGYVTNIAKSNNKNHPELYAKRIIEFIETYMKKDTTTQNSTTPTTSFPVKYTQAELLITVEQFKAKPSDTQSNRTMAVNEAKKPVHTETVNREQKPATVPASSGNVRQLSSLFVQHKITEKPGQTKQTVAGVSFGGHRL